MRRRTLLAAVAAAAMPLSGCVDRPVDGPADGTGSSDGTTVRNAFDGDPSRPECQYEAETVSVGTGDDTNEYRTAEPAPYPDPPDEFEDDDVIEYVEAFEEAYTSHDAICDSADYILDVGYSTLEQAVPNRHDGITTVYLLRVGGATRGVGDEGPPWAVELAPGTVGYAVDETGAARVEAEEPVARDELGDTALEPLAQGELVAEFE